MFSGGKPAPLEEAKSHILHFFYENTQIWHRDALGLLFSWCSVAQRDDSMVFHPAGWNKIQLDQFWIQMEDFCKYKGKYSQPSPNIRVRWFNTKHVNKIMIMKPLNVYLTLTVSLMELWCQKWLIYMQITIQKRLGSDLTNCTKGGRSIANWLRWNVDHIQQKL